MSGTFKFPTRDPTKGSVKPDKFKRASSPGREYFLAARKLNLTEVPVYRARSSRRKAEALSSLPIIA
jgi:hypothetical protein